MTLAVVGASETTTHVVGRGAGALAEAALRLEALRTVAHPGVAVPIQVALTPDGDVVATTRRAAGEDAATVLRLRGGLSAGECVGIGVDVAEALAALHAAGLAHGDVSPANIVVTPTRAILVDTLAGARAGERGTRGFGAPERAVAATPAGDVYSLGKVLGALACEDAAERVGAWAEPLCRPDPADRPTAAVAARALRACADPVAVEVPIVGVAAAVRARAVEPDEETMRLATGRVWRVRRAAVRWVRMAAVGAVALTLVLLAVRLVAALVPEQRPNYLPTIPIPADALASRPDAAAAELVSTRLLALASGDPDALLGVSAPGSPARAEDAPLVGRLAAGDLGYDGLVATVTSVETLEVAGSVATVRVAYVTSSHVVRDGEASVDMPETTAVVDVDVAWEDGAWRIVRTRPRP